MNRLCGLFGKCFRTSLMPWISIIGGNHCLQYNRKPSLNGWTQLTARSAHLVDNKKTTEEILNQMMGSLVNFQVQRRDWYGIPVTVGNGTGFIVDASGLVVTNCHVAQESPLIEAIVYSRDDTDISAQRMNFLSGQVVYVEPDNDLALVQLSPKDTQRVAPTGLPAVSFTAADHLIDGEDVLIIGCPKMSCLSLGEGNVMSTERSGGDLSIGNCYYVEFHGNRTDRLVANVCKTSEGCSGAPVVNMYGQVVGVHFAAVDFDITMASNGQKAKGIVERYEKIKGKYLTEKYLYENPNGLGIIAHEFDQHVKQHLDPDFIEFLYGEYVNHPGIYVSQTLNSDLSQTFTDFYATHLCEGDLIIQIDGKELKCFADFEDIIRGKDEMTATVVRNCNAFEMNVKREPIHNFYFM